MTNEKDSANLGAQTVKKFLDQFGNPTDPHIGLFLEVLLEELYHAKIVSISGISQQTGDQSDHHTGGDFSSHFPSHGSPTTSTIANLANSDSQDS
jgi:hypothetical protein